MKNMRINISQFCFILMSVNIFVKIVTSSGVIMGRGGATRQICKSGRAFRIGFGPKVDKILGLIWASDVLFVLGAQKYNQKNLATLLNEDFI